MVDKIPFRELSEEVRVLFVEQVTLCKNGYPPFKEGNYYPTRLKVEKDYYIDADKSVEIEKHVIAVNYGSKEHILSLKEFARHFQTPEIKHLATKFPDYYKKIREFGEVFYRHYNLNHYQFQIDDIPLLLMKDNAVLAYEQGLGKCQHKDTYVDINSNRVKISELELGDVS